MTTPIQRPATTATAPATAPSKPLPHTIPASKMRLARMRGEVEPLSPQFPGYVRFRGHWWLNDDTEFVRVADQSVNAILDRVKANSATRIDEANQGRHPAGR